MNLENLDRAADLGRHVQHLNDQLARIDAFANGPGATLPVTLRVGGVQIFKLPLDRIAVGDPSRPAIDAVYAAITGAVRSWLQQEIATAKAELEKLGVKI